MGRNRTLFAGVRRRTLAAVAGVACATLAASTGCSAILGIDDLPGPAPDAASGDATFADAPPADATRGADGAVDAGVGKGEASSASGDADANGGGDDAGDGGANEAGPVVSLDGCVLLLHMDESSWPATGSVKDSSGLGNDGTAVGTAVPTPGGKFGGAALLDGNGWIDVPSSVSLDGPMSALTYSAWIYPTGLTDGSESPGIISKRQGYGENVAFTLFLWVGNAAWVDLQGYRSSSDASFGNNAWYHVAVVYDGSQADAGLGETIYVNGVVDSVHPADPSLAVNTQDILVGNLPGGGNNFVGMIDEVTVWTRALDANEIKSLYLADGGL
jgi:hypothetical protein